MLHLPHFCQRLAAPAGRRRQGWKTYRMPAALLLAGLAGFAAFTGCRHAPPPEPPPPKVVMDYRNGWYHKASGSETVDQIARHYHRDVTLVTELNLAGGPTDMPQSGTMLYIPPNNDRQYVHDVLTRLQGHPDLIPKKPWDPAAAAKAAAEPAPGKATGAAEPARQTVEIHPAEPDRPSNPFNAKGPASELAKIEPPAPGSTETTLAEAPAAKKPGFFGWFLGGSSGSPASAEKRPVAARPTPKPARLAKAEAFLWPVKGQVVTTFKGGWTQSCHGIEIAAEEGTPVRASRGGRVLLARPYMGYGNLILIDHGDGYSTAYGYTRQILVKEGQHVERGQTIASVGRPTQGSSSKLLFEVRRNPLPVDPLPYLKDS